MQAITATLAVIGFGSEGVIAGTLAAGIQSLIGSSVQAGGLFAILTSIAMTGAFPPLLIATLTIAGVAIGFGILYALFA